MSDNTEMHISRYLFLFCLGILLVGVGMNIADSLSAHNEEIESYLALPLQSLTIKQFLLIEIIIVPVIAICIRLILAGLTIITHFILGRNE